MTEVDRYTNLKDKNSTLKGRRRFLADLTDMSAACALGFALKDFNVCGA
jgi:hypothetical protein